MTASDRLIRQAAPIARADFSRGDISATALLAATPDRVFRALTSAEICDWWVRPGVFDTREWRGDVRVGGRWGAAGVGGGQPYRLAGEYLEIAAPVRLVHTWKAVGSPGEPGTVSYRLDQEGDCVRLRVDHTGLTAQEICEKTRAGWETSLLRLADMLAKERALASA